MKSDERILSAIVRCIELQEQLVTALKESFPQANVGDLIHSGFPKSGTVSTHGEVWKFAAHGAGFCFTSPTGLVVDVHRHLSVPQAVDVWRLAQFLESHRVPQASEIDEDQLTDAVARLVRAGMLRRVGGTDLFISAGVDQKTEAE